MSDEMNMQRAKAAYEVVKEAFTSRGLGFESLDNRLAIRLGIKNDKGQTNVMVMVNSAAQAIAMYSVLPFTVDTNKSAAMALAVCDANEKLLQGSFDFNTKEGRVIAKVTNSFVDMEVSKGMVSVMFVRLMKMLEEYSEKLRSASKGIVDLSGYFDFE